LREENSRFLELSLPAWYFTTPEVQSWLKRHPRFVPHFIPTSSSWVNLVERWFGELTQKAVRRGAFASVPDLVQTIEESLRERRIGARPRTL